MSPSGGSDDILVLARAALLDALTALDAHHESVVVIGAQAVYLHTGGAPVAVAEATKDSDVAIDLRTLGDDPLIEEAMRRAGFHQDLEGQPGAWLSATGIPVDLMVPDVMAGTGRRSVKAPPHDKRALRRATGLEAAMVDNSTKMISALGADDDRVIAARVAGPAALLVAKMHKLGERKETAPERLADKDAYDVYRLLVAVPTQALTSGFTSLLADPVARDVTLAGLAYLADLFGSFESVGSTMAGRSEEGVGDPAVVSAACAALTADLLSALGR